MFLLLHAVSPCTDASLFLDSRHFLSHILDHFKCFTLVSLFLNMHTLNLFTQAPLPSTPADLRLSMKCTYKNRKWLPTNITIYTVEREVILVKDHACKRK